MLIEIENTPNPATLKFLPGRSVMGSHPPLNFASCEDVAGRSALAESLFGLSDVKHVFLGHDFISVTKTDDADWASLRPVVLASLTSFLQSGQPLHSSLSLEEVIEETGGSPEDRDIIAQIRELLDERVRPAVAGDGGDIVFRGYKEGVVYLTMHGACSGCPSSKATLRHGVESMLRHYIPEIVAVEQIEE
ncbi:NifU family protein [Acetobacteraceae bacterium ESL0709]|nr:NifU family protein [Acetobacteraceae bacterium ESL0697]MDF7678478.1 NifU family protein [Acetobacteraceae bacterium ESL0709]